MNPAKTVLFCGTPAFAIPALKALIDSDAFDVRLVITQPDKPTGRAQVLTPPPIKTVAEKAGIPVVQPEDINADDLQLPDADFLITVAYGQIVKQRILDHAHIATVNVHGSLLPEWRGASPMQHSILKGDKTAGITIQKMVQKLDAGPILSKKEVPLTGTETIEQLHDTLAELSASLLIETLSNPLHPVEQNEEDASFCKKLSRADGEVDTKTMTAEEIDRHVRALVPWPGVTCAIDGETVKLHTVSLRDKKNTLALQCKNNTVLHVETLQPPGKKIMSADAWSRGRQNS